MARHGQNFIRGAVTTGVFVFALAMPATAFAQVDATVKSASVNNIQVADVEPVVNPNPNIALGSAQQPAETLAEHVDNDLAATGEDVVGLALIGAGAVGIGALLLAARRRSHAQ